MRPTIFASLLLLVAPHADAETLYVTDLRSVELRAAPGEDAAIRSRVTSGTQLEILAHRDNDVKVRTAEGQEGWLREELLASEPPAHARLQLLARTQAELEEEMTRLRTSMGRLQEAQMRLLDENHRLVERLRTPAAPPTAAQSTLGSWGLAALLLGAAAAAFAVGAFWQARRRS
jgi:SH3 domain protein